MMTYSVILNLTAIIALLLPALYYIKMPKEVNFLFWFLTVLALVTSASWSGFLLSHAIAISLGSAIWLSVTTTLLTFIFLCLFVPLSRRLTPLLMPYLGLLGFGAFIWFIVTSDSQKDHHIQNPWVIFHITLTLFTYALATLAAISALSAFIMEKSLKSKKPNLLSALLPSVFDSEMLTVKLLFGSELILGLGILSGIGINFMEYQTFLIFDHKTLFSISAFVVIGGLLLSHQRYGTRGKQASRFVLVAYLMLNLGFLGVKFVTDLLNV